MFVGAGRVAERRAALGACADNLRMLPVTGPAENVGLRKVSVHRSLGDPETWEIFVATKNYGRTPHTVPLLVQFGGAPVGSKRLTLAAGGEETATFKYRTRSAGWIEARILARDAFPEDDRAVLELPALQTLPVTVYSDEPDLLRPVFTVIPAVKVNFLPTARFNPNSASGIVILDRFAPTGAPQTDAVWIAPPARSSPISVRSHGQQVETGPLEFRPSAWHWAACEGCGTRKLRNIPPR